MNTDLMFSSKYTEWQTPRKLYEYFNNEYKFTLDVACSRANCLSPFGIFGDEGQDGLTTDWGELCNNLGGKPTCFMNPPYGRGLTEKWVRKAWDESECGVTTVALLPARPDTKWFMDYCARGEVIFIAGRLKFYDPTVPKEKRRYNKNGDLILDPAPFPSCIVVFTPESWPRTLYWSESRGMFD